MNEIEGTIGAALLIALVFALLYILATSGRRAAQGRVAYLQAVDIDKALMEEEDRLDSLRSAEELRVARLRKWRALKERRWISL